MNSQNTGVLGKSWHRLLEAAEETVSRSFLCLGFVVNQSVMLVERFFSRRRTRCRGEDVWLCMCACVRVGFDKIMIIIHIIVLNDHHMCCFRAAVV